MGGPGGDEVRRELVGRVAMHRRRFLGLMAGGAGLVVLGACSDDDTGDGASGDPTTTASGSSSTASTAPAELPGAQGLDADPFTLGVASGDPVPTSVILWTRLAIDPIARDGTGAVPDADIEVLWEVASDEDFAQVVASGIEVASPDFGHSLHVDPEGLTADTRYWYRFRVGEFTSPVGRTRTTPDDDATVDELRIGVASCQLRSAGYWTAYEQMAEDDLDLVFFLGDYIYEYPAGEGELASVIEAEPQTEADYRLLYGAYKRDPMLQAAHASAPWVVTWDDHEVDNNYAGVVPEDPADAPTFAARRRAAYQVFWENMPVRLDPPDDEGLRLYRTVRFGSLATFFVLDGRQYRTDQVCGDQIPTMASECPALGDESHTMLGTEQEDWLSNGLSDADTTWKALAQQTVMKALVLGDVVLNVDQWDGYPAARARLLSSIQEDGVENVMVMTGDIHVGGAADIRGTDAATDGPILAHELVVPGISSPGLGFGDGIDTESLGLIYSNLTDNGYARAVITPETWRTEWMVVGDIAAPGAPVTLDATAEVTAGSPGLRLV